MKGRTDVRRLYVRTDVHDVMAIKPNFLTAMGYHIFLTMVLRARSSAIISSVTVLMVSLRWELKNLKQSWGLRVNVFI